MSSTRRSAIELSLSAFAAVWLGTPGHAATLGPDLEKTLEAADDDALLPVVIRLPDQLRASELDDALTRRGLRIAERHGEIMRALRSHAAAAQAPYLERLRSDPVPDEVQRIRPRWIANVIEVDATPAGVAFLAETMGDAQLETRPVAPIPPLPASPPPGAQSSGHDWNLDAIGAPALWAMGIHGEGTIVAHLDTGVDAAHPALAERWRGAQPGVEWSEAWFTSDDSQIPTDSGTHGTHTMGTMTGAVEGDTVGVAPAAHWIAAQLYFSAPPGVSPWEAFEWCADPDGNPQTYDDVPDVVSNSWVYVAYDCVPWDSYEIDNMEAMGAVAIFGAGNDGPGPETVMPPANRADDALTNFAVGATSMSGQIAGFSSRGPTQCDVDDSLSFKPEVAAPGVSVRSTVPRGRYAFFSGTSMATPHVAGAAALLRQIVPELSAAQVKRTLLETARHPQGPGLEDDVYGRGIIDVEAAARALFEKYAVVGGARVRVIDAESGAPIPRARVLFREAHSRRLTDAAGEAVFELLAGDYTLSVVEFSHHDSQDLPLSVVADQEAQIEVELASRPAGTLSGRWTDPAGAGIAARLAIYYADPETLLEELETDLDGSFSVELMAASYRVDARPAPPQRFFEVQDVVVDSAQVTDLSRAVEAAAVLLVDADGGEVDYESYFVEALAGAGASHNHWDRAQRGAAAEATQTMPSSSAVVWFSGDRAQGAMDAAEEQALIAHLEADGRLFLTGRDLAQSLEGGALLHDRLGVSHLDDTNENHVPPRDFSELGALIPGPIFTSGFLPPVNQVGQDVLGGGDPAADYAEIETGAALVAVEAPAGGRAVVAGFGLEGVHSELPGGVTRAELLSAVLTWLAVPLESSPGSPPAAPRSAQALGHNHPNPFNPRTVVPIELTRRAAVRLSVYDQRGTLVATLVDGVLEAGRHAIPWDGRNATGRAVASGVYLLRLEAEGRRSVRRAVLLK